jgi:hypothetical protein
MSGITVHGEKSHVADIIGAAATEIVEQEYRAGKFALTDGIVVVEKGGHARVATLLDYSIERCTWSTALFLIRQGCPIVADLEDEARSLFDGHEQFSSLAWAMMWEDGLYDEKEKNIAWALMELRDVEIDILKTCALGYDPRQDAEHLFGGPWIGRGSVKAPLSLAWPPGKTSWNALEFCILFCGGSLLDVMLRTQAVSCSILRDLMKLCRDRAWAYNIMERHWVVAEQREKRALATAWTCKAVPGNVWRDLAGILVPRVLAHAIRQQDDGQEKKKKLKK